MYDIYDDKTQTYFAKKRTINIDTYLIITIFYKN